MNARIFIVDGKTYHSIDEMPPDVRQKYEQAMHALADANNNQIPDVIENANILADNNKNGIPDLLENITKSNVTVKTVKSMKFIVDGKEFHNLEDLPPEARAHYEKALGKLDANQNGIPDFLEGVINSTNETTNVSTSVGTDALSHPTSIAYAPTVHAPSDKVPPGDSAITPDTSNGWRLAFAGLFILLLCVAGAAGVWYFFLR